MLGCLTDNQVARGVHVLETTATGKLVKIPIYAIMFVRGSSGNKNTLFFSCSVQLCDGSAGNASTCNAPTCTVDFTPDVVVERRRRAADGDTKVVGRALTVRFGNATQEEEFMHEEDGYEKEERVRSDVDSLTVEQIQNIREALQAAKNDETISGYNQIAAFHGQPNWCPSPAAEKKYACCTHGMAVFPHWHRLLTVQAENALVANGLHGGLPYWDWTLPITSLPAIVKEEFYTNPKTGESTPNPLYNGLADGHPTTRSVRDELFEAPAFGSLTRIAEQVMLAFEQTDFCDFEVQYEIAQNYIHALVGGNEEYSMASLRFSAYDPIFFLHHSNTDRLWAIWQELQKYRGLPYNSANCAIASLRQPLQPFAQDHVTNPDPVTRDHSTPFDVFNYENSFHYHYDNLQFNGMSIPQIQREVIKRAAEERVFAGFMLHGIKKSSLVVFEICKPTGDCKKAGEFYLLGDEYELPWEFDRLFKYEITDQLSEFGLEPLDMYEVKYEVFDLARASLGTDIFGVPPQIYLSPYGRAITP
ncbi:hemocyanin 2-c chain-like [Littorina saxatilis]|uniref:hemocyanin 2-c chain-like n=1 Tax=Littorina saxatilis TaxID=31220 RepID=UPI0038B425B7